MPFGRALLDRLPGAKLCVVLHGIVEHDAHDHPAAGDALVFNTQNSHHLAPIGARHQQPCQVPDPRHAQIFRAAGEHKMAVQRPQVFRPDHRLAPVQASIENVGKDLRMTDERLGRDVDPPHVSPSERRARWLNAQCKEQELGEGASQSPECHLGAPKWKPCVENRLSSEKAGGPILVGGGGRFFLNCFPDIQPRKP